MSVDANRMGSLILAHAGSTAAPNVTETSPSTKRPEEIEAQPAAETASGSSAPSPPRDWDWLRKSTGSLLTLCKREAALTSHSRETLRWGSLVTRLEEVHRGLSDVPAVELGSLKLPPLQGQEEAHGRAAALASKTLEVVSEVSTTAAAGGHKTPLTVLQLCGKIALGLLATLGGVAASLIIPAAGPYLAVWCAVVGSGIIGNVVFAHAEHNRHVADFQRVDEFLDQLNLEMMKQEEQEGAETLV
jgi:hypothetical protein